MVIERKALVNPGDVLREKLVSFQREIADLKQRAKEHDEESLQREQKLFLELIDVIDIFDTLEHNLRRKTEPLDRTSVALLNTLRAIQRKLFRLLASHHIVPLEFSDRKAKVEQCHIIDTRRVPTRQNEEILSIEKRGYINTERNCIVRKAEVVTVCNDK
jgi:molecular chaperone GrpE (heat shock protein)